tara:strand:- start:509 stop:730 length:222 start_codon:yes stop_codon:yes gene_type:complete
MEVKRDEGMNVGTNPFYQPNNASYGTNWQASNGTNPVQMGDIPLYSDIVSIFINLIFSQAKASCFCLSFCNSL